MHTNARHIGLTSVSLHRPLCANLERLCNFLGILLVLSVPLLGLSMVAKVTIGAGGHPRKTYSNPNRMRIRLACIVMQITRPHT